MPWLAWFITGSKTSFRGNFPNAAWASRSPETVPGVADAL